MPLSINERWWHSVDASSILEEDIIKICIWFGHTHPVRVHWYSAIELVILFHTMDKLQIMKCGVVTALTLHEEAIRVRTSSPSAAHVQAYMAAVTEEPSATQPPPSDGRRNPIYPPQQLPPRWEKPTTPPGKPWGSRGKWVAIAYGGTLQGDCTLWAECTPQKPTSNTLGETPWEMGIMM